MTEPFHRLEAEGIEVVLDLRVGHIRSFVATHHGRRLAPFHTAPWVDDPAVTGNEALAPNLRFLSGDFFCAPFSTNDVEEAPSHGWPANSAWRHVGTEALPDGNTAVYRLERTVFGATLDKRFTVRDGHPFLYETHVFTGGSGALPVANHPMASLPGGGRLAFSPKQAVQTPPLPLETDPAVGRSILVYPFHGTDPTRVPRAGGGAVDLTRFPIAERHDDFAILAEAEGSRLGWCVVSRPDRGDALISLKDPREFPLTFLWFSNGGRDYAPWNGRHFGVLGIEEGRADSIGGHRASLAANSYAAAGIPTTLVLDPAGSVSVRNVVGALPLPESGAPIAAVAPGDQVLNLTAEDGTRVAVPFDTGFLGPA